MSTMFHLTATELACGITMAEVVTARAAGYVLDCGAEFVAPHNASPTLASAAARYALGADVTFDHLAMGGYPVYVRAAHSPYAQAHDDYREPVFA